MELQELFGYLQITPEETDKGYIYNIANSDEYAEIYSRLDINDDFELDIENEDINLFNSTITYTTDNNLKITLSADFEDDTYTILIEETKGDSTNG